MFERQGTTKNALNSSLMSWVWVKVVCCNFRCHRGDGALRKQRVRCLATWLATKNPSDMYCGTRHQPTSTFRDRKPQRTIFRLVQVLQLKKRWGTDSNKYRTLAPWTIVSSADLSGQEQRLSGPMNWICSSFGIPKTKIGWRHGSTGFWLQILFSRRLKSARYLKSQTGHILFFISCFSPGEGHQSANAGEDKIMIRTLRLEDILVVFHVSSFNIFLLDLSL